MKKNNARGKKRTLYLLLFVISALILVLPLFLGFDYGFFKSLGLIGITLINFFASATLFLPAPGFLAIGLGGKVYDPIVVAGLSALGSTLGEIVGFAFGYSSKKISRSEKHMLDFVIKIFKSRYSAALIVGAAFVPNPFFDAVGIVAGLSFYPIKKFLFLVFLGRFLRDIIIAYAGRHFL